MNRRPADTSSLIIVSGSCVNFDEQRHQIVEALHVLEMGIRKKGGIGCSSAGKKYLGWDFFYLYFSPEIVNALIDLYPNISQQEANTIEESFVLWLDNQFVKRNLKYNLKLVDIPSEKTHGFKLDPENYRSDDWMENYR